jgi:hypothetical protein
VSNVGFRLLRWTARLEPPSTSWVRLGPEHASRSFATIDQTDLPIELEIPEALQQPLAAVIVLESNGGTRRVAVRIERPAELAEVPENAILVTQSEVPDWARRLGREIAARTPSVRIVFGMMTAVALRLLIVLFGLVPLGARDAPMAVTRLPSLAAVLVVGGIIVGGWLARRQGDRLDLLAAGFTGGLVGLLAAAVCFAVVHSVEIILGSWSSSIWAVAFLWGAIGAGLALASILLIPHRRGDPEAAK